MRHYFICAFFCLLYAKSNSQTTAYAYFKAESIIFSELPSFIINTDEIHPEIISQNEAFSIIRSVTGSSGASKSLETSRGMYNVSYSIGQSGIIGTHYQSGHSILQGYQQRNASATPRGYVKEDYLNAKVYPNPFNQSINILIEELITQDVFIQVFDMSARCVVSKKLPGSRLLNIPLKQLPTGAYVLIIVSGNKKFSGRILKQ